ncbi:hypothetical protein Q3G72_006674 [Acer saccharum]|nr:hypothetical protein Q3G72_006674 [Acer saccharum]
MSESELSSPVVSSVENPEPLCSICLEEISATCGRTVVTLQCSHIFHLGIMQCPNCRQIENGEWLCFENRDSETDMEQNFNQDVEDQEPEMVSVNSVFYPVPVIYSNALVQLQSGAGNVVSIAITNRSGVFSNIAVFPLNLNLSSLLSNCNLVVNTPLSQLQLPSVGRLQLPLQFIRNTLLGPFNILNITIVGPLRFQLLA